MLLACSCSCGAVAVDRLWLQRLLVALVLVVNTSTLAWYRYGCTGATPASQIELEMAENRNPFKFYPC
jgi:hypothetical protein